MVQQSLIIGGADGPTAVFLANNNRKMSPRDWIRSKIYQIKRKRVSKRIRPSSHSLKKMVAFMKSTYGIREVSPQSTTCQEREREMRTSLILKYQSEDLGIILPNPDDLVDTYQELEGYMSRVEECIARADVVPPEQFPMDFHYYKMKIPDGELEVEIDFKWNVFSVSSSGGKRAMRKLARITRVLYCYYGVCESDIKNKTERYNMLLTVLCS